MKLLVLTALLVLLGGGCAASGDPPSMRPALLAGDLALNRARVQNALRVRLEQPQLVLGADAFAAFHRITLAPVGPPAAVDRIRPPLQQIELLTDGSGCWLRAVGGSILWRVDGIDCVTDVATSQANTPHTN